MKMHLFYFLDTASPLHPSRTPFAEAMAVRRALF